MFWKRKHHSKEPKIIEKEQASDMPVFTFENPGIITLEGKAIPEFADLAWIPFLNKLISFTKDLKSVEVNFKLDYYNSSSNRFITDMMNILSRQYPHLRTTINWFFSKDDEDSEADAEMYRDSNKKIKFNIIEKDSENK